ncbi:MAG: CoA transferase, partial [Deltaproteobacteria bacterium]
PCAWWLLPAWLGEGPSDDPWAFVASRVADRSAEDVVERARLLGLAAAVAVEPDPVPAPWQRDGARGAPQAERARARPLVIDLSALWAGPLCAHLLGLAGARVVKVESTRRPDGARFGPTPFYDLLNAGKQSVALDFGTPEGRERLRHLVECADIVVESARPRALLQLGLDAASLVEALPGLTWVSITGYGRSGPGANWVAFGDDAGVAAGLATATGRAAGTPLFCGDAIADPLTGLHAALAALASWSQGGGQLVELALRDVVAHALAFAQPAEVAGVRGGRDAWEVVVGTRRERVAPPRSRSPRERARPLGADTDAVLRELGISC